MSSSNTNNNSANGPTVVQPKPSLGPLENLRKLVTESGHFVLRLYFSILLLVYFWFVKIFTRVLQPLQPVLQNVQKVPAEEATSEGIRKQLSQLVYTVLQYLAPLIYRVIAFVTKPLGWARDKVSDYVEQGEREATKITDPKTR